ncbi:MAG: hypothetical protein AB2805_03860 [Candidatus Thiodiazotropha sp.]
MTVAEREAREEIRRELQKRYAVEWERFKNYMTREQFDQWKRNEEEYLDRIAESSRNQWPSCDSTLKELDAAQNRLLEAYTPEALERYYERHDAYQAVYLPRFVEWAIEWMNEDPRWGGLDEVSVMQEVHEEVTRELGFDSNGLTYPPDPEESLFEDDNVDDWGIVDELPSDGDGGY